jgi:nickel/cobalt exporter
MSATTPALLAAAAGVGFGHAILPDHWVPLAVVGRTRRYPLGRVARLSTLAGIAHVLVSMVLGGVIIAVGLQFRSEVQSAQNKIIGGLLIATGVGFAIFELISRTHHHRHEHAHDQQAADTDADASAGPAESRMRGLAGVMVPFGAAASPDLTILPVFLAATTVGATTAIVSVVIFAAVTIATIVGLTLAACFGGYQIRGQWLERWGNVCTALVLIAIGALVLTSVL